MDSINIPYGLHDNNSQFIGLMALISGYILSLEDRLQREKKFHLFSLRSNLNASPKAWKLSACLGVMI
ncbi:hypothetical protein V2K69_10625 [Pseudomonas alliivorans]|nr:hypothetical protein [Pseudomonas alliivorans]MEE4721978.1 hypothetical protein [Pseudomonas alliivorans]MEE4757242.1 hypothetical protein [Pseudomonas alliivorans]MEE4764389.1 hypothetical protein [Pseudomonas alliivorans]MEE4773224.1 hypothetical protein [Pseudomonas alliivorans]